MKQARFIAIFVSFAVSAWLTATLDQSSTVPVFGPMEAAFVTLGLALGMALVNVWRIHERLVRPKLHLAFGCLVLGVGATITGLGFKFPVHIPASLMMMPGLAWTIVGIAGSRPQGKTAE